MSENKTADSAKTDTIEAGATGVVPIEALFKQGMRAQEIVDNYHLGVAPNWQGAPTVKIMSADDTSKALEPVDGDGCFYEAFLAGDGDVMIDEWYLCTANGQHCIYIATTEGITTEDWEILARPKVAYPPTQ